MADNSKKIWEQMQDAGEKAGAAAGIIAGIAALVLSFMNKDGK